ncbi:MAG TPA: hypothetical protein VE404_05345 [Verrucomicrobiae bacterium]|nr:hypothetical protein [Verrucomicrobiae bacterium]
MIKMDIEGAEESMRTGDLGWMDRVAGIVLELHRPPAECVDLVAGFESRGMKFLRLGEVHPNSVTAFVRRPIQFVE